MLGEHHRKARRGRQFRFGRDEPHGRFTELGGLAAGLHQDDDPCDHLGGEVPIDRRLVQPASQRQAAGQGAVLSVPKQPVIHAADGL